MSSRFNYWQFYFQRDWEVHMLNKDTITFSTMNEIMFTSVNVKVLFQWKFDDFPLHDSSFSGGHNSSSSPLFYIDQYCKENLCVDHTWEMLRFMGSRCCYVHEWKFGRTRNNVETSTCRSGTLFPLLLQVLSNFARITIEKGKSLAHFDYQQMYYVICLYRWQ